MPEPLTPESIKPAPVTPGAARPGVAGPEALSSEVLSPEALSGPYLPEPALPELVRLYLRNIALGFLLALVFTGLLLGLDVAHLRHLTFGISGGWLAVVMLVLFNTIVFAGVQFAIAVMRMAEPGDSPRRGNRAPIARRKPATVPVPAQPQFRPRG